MLNDKLCAIALTEKLRMSNSLIVESEYTKSDIIFYRFKNSNVAVSKNLNHVDFSILSQEDWNYLLETGDYYSNVKDDEINKCRILSCTTLISDWCQENSIVSKVYNIMNNQVMNTTTIADQLKKMERDKRILDLLVRNKARLTNDNGNRNYGYGNPNTREVIEEIEIDVSMRKEPGLRSTFDNPYILIEPSDRNINLIKARVEASGGNRINRTNALLGMLIIKYNTNTNSATFQNSRKGVYGIRCRSHDASGFSEQNFKQYYIENMWNALTNSTYRTIPSILFNSEYARDTYELNNIIDDGVINLTINYSGMTNEDLILFRDNVYWLIERHAKYVTVVEAEREAYLMFLVRNQLEGKKSTKIVLESHLNLANMRLELVRRGIV